METINKNLLRSVILDEEVASNQENGLTLIYSPCAAFHRLDPGCFDRCDAGLQYNTECHLH